MTSVAESPSLCVWCGEKLHFVQGKGWLHEDGGILVMKCKLCGWKGSPDPLPTKCPKCGSLGLRDDHYAIPDRS